MMRSHWQARLALAVVAITCTMASSYAVPYEVWVADRSAPSAQNPNPVPNVYRYNSNGDLLGSVIADPTGLSMPTGLALSPDQTKLYVSSSGNNTVFQYDYSSATGQATNPTVFADEADGISFPSTIKFSPDGSTLYVSNLQPSMTGGGVRQFDTAGNAVGFPLIGGSIFAYTGLDFTTSGDLVVGGFDNGSFEGGVLKTDPTGTFLEDLVDPNGMIAGASGIAVDGDDVYVVGLYTGQIVRYDVNTGALDPTFNIDLTANGFPQDIRLDPSGNGLLVGVLGAAQIARYGFDGSPLGTFADYTAGGFLEPTAFIVVVPEPASMVLLGGALVGLVGWRLRRTASRTA